MLQCSFLQRATFFFLFTIIRLPACSPCCCRLRCLHSCISVHLHVCACSSFASGQEYSPHSTSSSARQPSTAVIGKVQGSDCNQSQYLMCVYAACVFDSVLLSCGLSSSVYYSLFSVDCQLALHFFSFYHPSAVKGWWSFVFGQVARIPMFVNPIT